MPSLAYPLEDRFSGKARLSSVWRTFGTDRFLGPEWEERKIREFLAKR